MLPTTQICNGLLDTKPIENMHRYCSKGCLRADREEHREWCKAKKRGLAIGGEGGKPKVDRAPGGQNVIRAPEVPEVD